MSEPCDCRLSCRWGVLKLLLAGTITLSIVGGMLGCTQENTPNQPFELTGPLSERIAAIEKSLPDIRPIAPKLTRVEMIESPVGKAGGLGPTDYVWFYRLDGPPEVINTWAQQLPRREASAPFKLPEIDAAWWPQKSSLDGYHLHDFATVGMNGWIAVDQHGGTVLIHRYTR